MDKHAAIVTLLAVLEVEKEPEKLIKSTSIKDGILGDCISG